MSRSKGKKGLGIEKYGMLLMVSGFVLFYFNVSFNADGQNVFAPAVAARLGVESGMMLSVNSIAGLTGVIISICAGQLNRKIGPRLICGIAFLMGGIAYILAANAPSLTTYAMAMCFSFGGFSAAIFVGFGSLNANWFPKKLGAVMGIVTIGAGLSTMTYIAGFNKLIEVLGVGRAAFIPGGICTVVAIFGLLVHRDTPFQRGINPDNVSDEIYRNEYAAEAEEKSDGGWTILKLLRNRDTWLCALPCGLLMLCQMGIMSQLVVRNREVGFSDTAAIAVMSVIAVFGIACAPLIGGCVSRFGARKTAMVTCLLMALAMFLNILGIRVLYLISLLIIGVTSTAPPNFVNSLPGSVFGRVGFPIVNSVIFPIISAIQMSSHAINGSITLIFGSLKVTYLCFGAMYIVALILVFFVQERKYNQDYKKEMAEE